MSAKIEELKEYAEILINKDISVVPVKDKAPYKNNWQSTRGADVFKPDFDHLWSTANGIGVLCGDVSGIICLDIDIYEDDERLGDLRAELLAMLPPTYCGMIGNPKKPTSRLYRYNGEENKRFSSIGVDIISTGGQKVIPPSFNPNSKTYYQWVGHRLFDIDVDDLPTIPKEVLSFIYRNAKESNSWSDFKEQIVLSPEAGRCSHGSHDHISRLAVSMFFAGKTFEEIVASILASDKEINDNSDYLYFNCPSRKEFKAKDTTANAYQFVGEVFKRNASKKAEGIARAINVVESLDLSKLDLALTKQGKPLSNLSNVATILEADTSINKSIWFDSFYCKYMTNLNDDGSKRVREWDDDDDLTLTRYLQGVLGMHGVADDMVRKARLLLSKNNIKNEPRDWVSSLKWDGKSRIGNFFAEYLGSKDDEYTRAVSFNFWVAMVARIMLAGCKMDNMVILEGKQGSGKSTALSIIGGKWYVESSDNMDSNDFYQVLQGNLIIEIGELESFSKAEVTAIKKVISTATDRFRAPYARAPKDHPRQCIFVGTTNDGDYLKDATGGRRFWPIATNEISLGAIKRDRQQFFAEAYSKFSTGSQWHSVPKSAVDEQNKRQEIDPWQDSIAEYIQQRSDRPYFTISDILKNAIEINIASVHSGHSKRVGKVLRVIGWGNSKPIRLGCGSVTKGFFRV